MSIINKDREVLEGRKNPLKDAKVPLRDQIVRKLFNTLEEDKIGHKIVEAWQVESANLAEMLEKQQAYLRDLDDFIPADNEAPFAGSSNLHIPMPYIVSKTYHARFLQAIMGVDPPFTVKARREDGTQKVQMVEDLMRYTLTNWANHYEGVEEEVDSWLWNWVTTGTGILKTKWVNEYCRYTDVQAFPEPGAPQIHVVDGREVAIPTQILRDREISVTIPKFKGPVCEVVSLEDFRMVGGKGNPDKADMVIHRSWMTASEMWSMVDQGLFDETNVEEVIRSGKDYMDGSVGSDIKQQRIENVGKASLETEASLDRYEILEACIKIDVDGSGINTDVVCWVHEDTKALLRATYLYRIIPTGERPYSVIHFHKRPGMEYGVGLLELLHPMSKELDAMHNMRVDWGMLSNLPFGFYRASSSLDPNTIQLEPGALIPVDDPQRDVYFPQMGNKTAFGAQEEAAIQNYIERLTGISDLSLGVMTGSQGATRTASGVRAMLGESNSNLDVHLRRMNRGWKKFLKLLFHLLQMRVEPGFCFRITGEDGSDVFNQIFAYDLALDVDFDVSSNSANSNKSVQIEQAQSIMQITSNPLYIQLGIVGPAQAYNAVRNWMSAQGIKDINRYLQKPQEPLFMLDASEEFNRVVRGQEVPVTPQMDHDAFIAFTQHMIDAQQDHQTLEEDQIKAAVSQMKKHMEMKSALEQQQAQQQVQMQMQQNAVMSQNQAPPGLNPMEGSNPGGLPPVQQ